MLILWPRLKNRLVIKDGRQFTVYLGVHNKIQDESSVTTDYRPKPYPNPKEKNFSFLQKKTA